MKGWWGSSVFVNGVRCYVIDRHARRAPTVLRFGIALRKGHNHVLIKTTLNGFAEISARYLDAAGRPIPGLRELDVGDRIALRPHATPRADAPVAGAFPDGLHRLSQAALDASGETRRTLLLAAGLTAFRMRDTARAAALGSGGVRILL